jgi:uncharacterized membrane protein HdeD (DUF308 family)
MDIRIQHSKLGTIVLGLAALALGVVVFMNPSNAGVALTLAVGWVLTILGAVTLANAFTRWSVILSQLDLYWGILELLLGVLIVNFPGFFVAWIFVLLGIYVIIAGYNALFGANALRALGVDHAGGAIAAAILMIVLGFLVVVSPFAMADVTMMVCGVALVYTGIVTTISGFKMKRSEG